MEGIEGYWIIVQHYDDGDWGLVAVPSENLKESDYLTKFRMPADLPDDTTDAMIDLAGYVSAKLRRYFAGVKANQHRSAEARRASARKAIATRWARKKD